MSFQSDFCHSIVPRRINYQATLDLDSDQNISDHYPIRQVDRIEVSSLNSVEPPCGQLRAKQKYSRFRNQCASFTNRVLGFINPQITNRCSQICKMCPCFANPCNPHAFQLTYVFYVTVKHTYVVA